MILLGLKSKSTQEIYQIATRINVVHLFVISGFHISLFYVLLSKVLIFMKVPEKIALLGPLVPIIFYLYLLGFPISALRATLLVLVSKINKIFLKDKFSRVSVFNFVLLLMFVLLPMQIKSYSFILTFLATFAITFVEEVK